MQRSPRRFNTRRVLADMDMRGWNGVQLAKASGLSYPTISRFLNNQLQTAKTAERIARALGYSVRRYFSHVEAA